MAAVQRTAVVQSVPEQAIDAKRAAAEEVERLLQHPEDLKRLSGLLEDYTQKHQANKAQLTATVASQVDAAKSGLELLDTAQRTLMRMQACYKEIDVLCSETSQLIENHDKIAELSAVHYNLGKTLEDVENIMALPNEAAMAEELLRDDFNLLQAYESLALLEGTSRMAQQALASGRSARMNSRDAQNLSAYFNKVRETMGKFEERLWSIIRNFIAYGRQNPAMLVNAVRIVEIQETVDKQLEASGGPGGKYPRKAYRKRAEQQIGNCIQDTFAPLLQNCSRLATAGENTDQRTSEILDDAHQFVVQLADIYDYVSPCFPEKYQIFNVIWQEYHQSMAFMLDCVGACSEQLANGDILKVMTWVSRYQESCRELGIEDDKLEFPKGRGLAMLIDKYIERIHQTLKTWFTNILEGDLNSEPKMADDGKPWTPGAVDFFRIVNEQLLVVEDIKNGTMIVRTGEVILKVMREFQAAQEKHLQRDLSPILLCALVNNNARCYNESMDFAEHMNEILPEALKDSLDIEEQCRGFLELCKTAVQLLVGTIFSDTAVLEVFFKLYNSDEWKQGVTTRTIIETLKDYLEDYEQLVEASFYRRLVEACAEETVNHFAAAILTYLRTISETTLAGVEKDSSQLLTFFSTYTKVEKVSKMCQPLGDLQHVASANSTDDFVLAYTSLLQMMPGVTPALIERLISARTDLTKADVKEVMDQCREVYSQRVKADGGEPQLAATPLPGKGKAGGALPSVVKDSGFRVALLAVKRKAAAPKKG